MVVVTGGRDRGVVVVTGGGGVVVTTTLEGVLVVFVVVVAEEDEDAEDDGADDELDATVCDGSSDSVGSNEGVLMSETRAGLSLPGPSGSAPIRPPA
ncbi:hypothetical protein [Lentzea sp. NBRC 102530]|uniref:hypothetical protein n=1 Tax=Lentzea sp. NBRC 102530 TaxID=3032201 RepID=UPI002552DDA2|nr:hypothetical protein [Lentzea sp. NBRC 102530]